MAVIYRHEGGLYIGVKARSDKTVQVLCDKPFLWSQECGMARAMWVFLGVGIVYDDWAQSGSFYRTFSLCMSTSSNTCVPVLGRGSSGLAPL